MTACVEIGATPQFHCRYNGGDRACERHGDARVFCSWGSEVCGPSPANDGCVAQRPANECYTPCGDVLVDEDDQCLYDNSSSSSGMESDGSEDSSSSDTTAMGESESGNESCSSNDDCSPLEAPYCDDGQCVSCELAPDADGADLACVSSDPQFPVCIDGACLGCRPDTNEGCEGPTPICDSASHSCVGCRDHDDCGEAGCNLFTGACLPADQVVHIWPDSGVTALVDAIAGFGPRSEGTVVVHGNVISEGQATVDEGRVLAIVGEWDESGRPQWEPGPDVHALVVAEATVMVDGIDLVRGDFDEPAVRLDGGQAWFERCSMYSLPGGSLSAHAGSNIVVQNSFIAGLSSRTSAVIEESRATIRYTTMASESQTVPMIMCVAPESVEIQNSILVGSMAPELPLDCVEASVVDSALSGQSQSSWFEDFSSGNLHLSETGAAEFQGIARWRYGHPPRDIDGDPRPVTDGSPDYPGADVPTFASNR
ncbi:MAG: hypothetical protein AAF799_17905 [Myxococcota bacterium]